MRRSVLTLFMIVVASAAFASSQFLDLGGTLWSAMATSQGLRLTGTNNGQIVVDTTIPFGIALAGTSDTNINVAADDLTGKVVVAWQRNWSPTVSELMLAVWQAGSWERINQLTPDIGDQPTNPAIQISQVSTAVPDPSQPNNPAAAQTVTDSFVTTVWWDAGGDSPHASVATICLTADPNDPTATVYHNLDDFAALGLTCASSTPPDVLQHPIFGTQFDHSQVMVFFGSQHICLFQLLQIQFALATSGASGNGTAGASLNRARHIPIFGVMQLYPMISGVEMDGLRVILGSSLSPVAYRVNGTALEYMTCGSQGWSPLRTLPVNDTLTMDQAIPLVENLAR